MFRLPRVPVLLLAGAFPLFAGCRSEPSEPAATDSVVAADPAPGDRLMRDLEVLAHDSMAGRAVGTEGGRLARDYIVAQLRSMGLEPALDTFAVNTSVEPDSEPREGVNVRVTLPGTAHADRYIVTIAHYDHLGVREGEVYNGADDNASGTAGLLSLVRGWVDTPTEHSMIALFTDAEEGGLRGARHFVDEPPVPIEQLLLAVNLDMVGHSTSELWVAGTWPWPSLRPLVEAVEPAEPVELRFGHDTPEDQGADNWVMASDHGPFHRAGVPFLYFGVADHPDYHRPTDDVATIDPSFFRGAVETVRRVVARADASLDGGRSGSGR